MDLKHFILIFLCGYLNNAVFSETEASTTEMQPKSTLLRSSVSNASASSQNGTGNPLSQPTQVNNISSGQPTPSTKVTARQPLPATYATFGKLTAHTSAGQPLASNITRQPSPISNSSQRTALPAFTSAGQLPPSAHTSTRQPPPPFVYTSAEQVSLPAHTSSGKSIPSTVHNLSIQSTSNVKISPMITPVFNIEITRNKKAPHKTKANSIAAILIGVILTSMLVVIMMIVLWKCLRKPVLNDQNWAGRSPFADGETPDICMDNIRENELSGKRTSIVSLMTWKPSKSTLLADDLEIKLFESSENLENSNNPQTEKIKDPVNGTSEDSAGGSTIGTAVSSSDDADLPPPLPLLDLEGQESTQSEKPTMTILSPLPNDSTNPSPFLDCLNQACEDHNSEIKQSFPTPPDSVNLPSPLHFMKTQEESNNEIQCHGFSTPPISDQDLNESLPLPPAELL
ncbi:protein EVI2B [Orycteropus afer afer]|uniref:Protein EVI2B n=1 Tax=Orycteropus afer afer TaxID=1230840 RepID=A0A8B6ZIP5_ORYAF|nr:protein EVI2B [Orycteropus afer afer]